MKIRIKKDSHRKYMIAQCGITITKDEWTEVDADKKGINYLISRSDVEILPEEVKKEQPKKVEPKPAKKEEVKSVKKEVFTDKPAKKSFKAVIKDIPFIISSRGSISRILPVLGSLFSRTSIRYLSYCTIFQYISFGSVFAPPPSRIDDKFITGPLSSVRLPMFDLSRLFVPSGVWAKIIVCVWRFCIL